MSARFAPSALQVARDLDSNAVIYVSVPTDLTSERESLTSAGFYSGQVRFGDKAPEDGMLARVATVAVLGCRRIWSDSGDRRSSRTRLLLGVVSPSMLRDERKIRLCGTVMASVRGVRGDALYNAFNNLHRGAISAHMCSTGELLPSYRWLLRIRADDSGQYLGYELSQPHGPWKVGTPTPGTRNVVSAIEPTIPQWESIESTVLWPAD